MKVVCPSCKVTNNVNLTKGSPVCGKCKSQLEPGAPGYCATVTDASFEEQVARSSHPVLLDLWGPSCPPCVKLAPILQELAKEMTGRVKVAKINVEENQATLGRFHVRGIPTLILLKSGREVARTSGFQGTPQLRAFLEQHL